MKFVFTLFSLSVLFSCVLLNGCDGPNGNDAVSYDSINKKDSVLLMRSLLDSICGEVYSNPLYEVKWTEVINMPFRLLPRPLPKFTFKFIEHGQLLVQGKFDVPFCEENDVYVPDLVKTPPPPPPE
jgi:hypothetical protein